MKKLLLSIVALAGFAGVAVAEDYPTGSASAPLTVADFISQGAPAKGSGVAGTYVKGYIVGDATGMNLSSGIEWEAPFTSGTNILIAASSSETDITRCIPVQLPTGDVRTNLNLQANPNNLEHCIILCGSRETYFSVPGLKTVTSYEWVGDAPTPGGGEVVTPPVASTHLFEGLTASTYKEWTINDGNLTEGISYVWKWDSSYNYMTASAYVSGTSYATDATLTSPVIDLTNATDCALTMTNIINKGGVDACKIYVQEVGGARVALDVQPMPAGTSWEKIEGTASLKAFDGKKIQIILNYVSTTSNCPTWEVCNVYIDGNGTGSTTPVVPGAHVYQGLLESSASLTGWTLETVEECAEVENIFSWKTYNNSSYLNGTTNLGGTPYSGSAIAYSEVIDLTEYTELTATFEHCAKFQTALKDLCWFGVREEGATDWTKLTIPTWPEAGAWTWANAGTIDLSAYNGKKIQLCFWYEGSATLGADTWEIRNVYVDGSKKATGVEEVAVEEGEALYFNLQGVQVANPENGLYVKVVNGKATKVYVK